MVADGADGHQRAYREVEQPEIKDGGIPHCEGDEER